MELIQLWAKLIFPEGFAFCTCTAVWLFSPDPSAVQRWQSRTEPCGDRDTWQGHSTECSAAWAWLLLEVWVFCINEEGSGQKVSGHSPFTTRLWQFLSISGPQFPILVPLTMPGCCLWSVCRGLLWMALEPVVDTLVFSLKKSSKLVSVKRGVILSQSCVGICC